MRASLFLTLSLLAASFSQSTGIIFSFRFYRFAAIFREQSAQAPASWTILNQTGYVHIYTLQSAYWLEY